MQRSWCLSDCLHNNMERRQISTRKHYFLRVLCWNSLFHRNIAKLVVGIAVLSLISKENTMTAYFPNFSKLVSIARIPPATTAVWMLLFCHEESEDSPSPSSGTRVAFHNRISQGCKPIWFTVPEEMTILLSMCSCCIRHVQCKWLLMSTISHQIHLDDPPWDLRSLLLHCLITSRDIWTYTFPAWSIATDISLLL